MADLANVSALIDRVTDRFGLNDAAARARVLGWIQTAYEELFGFGDWWWKQVREDGVWTPGTRDYTTEDSTNVIEIAYASGVPLRFYAARDFSRMFAGHIVIADTPGVWTGQPLDGGIFQFQVWPTPSSADPYTLTKEALPGVLLDNLASVPLIPEPWRNYLLHAAEMHACQFDQQHGTYESFLGKRNEVLQAMQAEDGRRPKVVR